MDEKDLKIQAYRQRLSQLEDENADYRVAITVLQQQNEQLKGEIAASEETKEVNEPVQTEKPAAKKKTSTEN